MGAETLGLERTIFGTTISHCAMEPKFGSASFGFSRSGGGDVALAANTVDHRTGNRKHTGCSASLPGQPGFRSTW